MALIYDEALAPAGLRATQYSMLTHIARDQGLTMRTLANSLAMDLSALGHTLKPLERDGLVVLHVDEKDRRSRRVFMTESGQAKYREAMHTWQRVTDAFESIFGVEEAVRLRERLDFIASDGFKEELQALLAAS